MDLIQGTYAKIDLDKLGHNYKILKENAKDRLICSVIKAGAYGHGQVAVARDLEEMGTDYFAVSSLQEALVLRNNGITRPILILSGPLEGQAGTIVKKDLDTTVFNLDQARALDKAAKALGKKARIHIKIDSGMGRIGFLPGQEALEDIQEISNMNGLNLIGIFTHFATADEEGDYASVQRESFYTFVDKLKGMGISFDLIHSDNTAASMIMDNPSQMERLGIGLYGLYPSAYVKEESDLDLKPVMSLYSVLTNIKRIEKGDSVSYGRTFVAPKDMDIGTVAIGYGDGLSRLLSNKGKLYINDRPAPIVGNVCMDQVMVDLTGIKCKIGDWVEVLGPHQDAQDLAEITGTIAYEVLTSVSPRVPRIYVKNGQEVDELWYFKER